jgi:hypothetical protein
MVMLPAIATASSSPVPVAFQEKPGCAIATRSMRFPKESGP